MLKDKWEERCMVDNSLSETWGLVGGKTKSYRSLEEIPLLFILSTSTIQSPR